MRHVNLTDLRPGERRRGALYDPSGRCCLGAEQSLTQRLIDDLHAAGWSHVFEDVEEPDTAESPVAPAQHEEMPAPEAIPNQYRLRTHLRERWAIRAGIRRTAESVVTDRQRRWARLPLRVTPATVRGSTVHPDGPEIAGIDERVLFQARAERIEMVRRLINRLVSGETVGVGVLNEIVDELIDEAARRRHLFATIALGTLGRADALAEHCFATGALSIGIAMRLGWSRADVRAAGLAGILADAGLALLPMPVRMLCRPLTDIELNAVRRHCTYSAALIERIVAPTPAEAIPESVQLAVFQHHEREDGSGYPTGIRGSAIHDLAKTVAVADVLAGSIAPRAHRPPLPAPTAIADVVRQANAGILDRPAAMALVELCGIYPPGSRVRLNTGHEALVLCNGRTRRLDRPVVRVLASGVRAGEVKPGEPLDLSWWRDEEIRVVGAVAA